MPCSKLVSTLFIPRFGWGLSLLRRAALAYARQGFLPRLGLTGNTTRASLTNQKRIR